MLRRLQDTGGGRHRLGRGVAQPGPVPLPLPLQVDPPQRDLVGHAVHRGRSGRCALLDPPSLDAHGAGEADVPRQGRADRPGGQRLAGVRGPRHHRGRHVHRPRERLGPAAGLERRRTAVARHDGQARLPVRSLVPALEPRAGAEDARRPRGRVRPPQPHARAVRGHRRHGARMGDRAQDAHVDVDGPAPALRHGHALPAPEVPVRAVLGEEGRPHRRALRPGARHALHAGQRQRHEQQAALGFGRDAHRAHEGRSERHRRAVPP
ncbi:hypothetical protein D9M72_426760 [compost metagenome]